MIIHRRKNNNKNKSSNNNKKDDVVDSRETSNDDGVVDNNNNNNNDKKNDDDQDNAIITKKKNESLPTSIITGDIDNKKNDKQEEELVFHYEFGGPVGTTMTCILLPLVVLLLTHWSHIGYVDLDSASLLCPNCFLDVDVMLKCFMIIIGWLIFQVILERILPYRLVYGTPIQRTIQDDDIDDHTAKKNSNKIANHISSTSATTKTTTTATSFRLDYRINGHLSFWITVMLTLILTYTEMFPYRFLYERFAELAVCTTLVCYVGSLYLYISSFQTPKQEPKQQSTNNRNTNTSGKILAKGGTSGSFIYDYWMGRELNPRCFNDTFDLKFFCELRPGLMGWMLFNWSCLLCQYYDNIGNDNDTNKLAVTLSVGGISLSMILINIFQGIYVWDALYQESAILTTMDITTDGFGFMLLFGDLSWVPYTYSIQSRYLVHNDPQLSSIQLFLVLAIYLFGYYIFRSSNGQKDLFRTQPNHPNVNQLSYMNTKRGTKLLTAGWWGIARKINYTGDYIMAISWCMLCGFQSLVPYYYVVYFAILLIHRSIRDDILCYHKYGQDWIQYKTIVPYKFIPGII